MATNWTERRVVITGLGVVTPIGSDIETFWKNLISGQCGIEKITTFDPSPFATQIAGQVKNFDPKPAFPSPRRSAAPTAIRNSASLPGTRRCSIRAWNWPRKIAMRSVASSAQASADWKRRLTSTMS
jgi:hypothetical protein